MLLEVAELFAGEKYRMEAVFESETLEIDEEGADGIAAACVAAGNVDVDMIGAVSPVFSDRAPIDRP